MRALFACLILLGLTTASCAQNELSLPPCASDEDCTEEQVCRSPASGGNMFCVNVSDIRPTDMGSAGDMDWMVQEPDASMADANPPAVDMATAPPDMQTPADTGPTCLTCDMIGANCGMLPDGCGGVLDCGSCGAGENCGGGGPNICGPAPCEPTTCEQQQAACGDIADGCGGTLSCGSCGANESCVQNQCVCADCGLHVYNATNKRWTRVSIQADPTHEPSTKTSAATVSETNGRALIFTDTTYHLLDLAQRRWFDSGRLDQDLPDVAGFQLTAGNGITDDMGVTTIVLTAVKNGTPKFLVGTYDAPSNSFSAFEARDPGDDWGTAIAPDATRLTAAWIDLSNDMNGLIDGSPDGTCPNAEGVDAYIAAQIVLTDSNMHIYDASYCAMFAERRAFSAFEPFTVATAPNPRRIEAAFLHGKTLYVVVGREPLR